MPHFFRRLSFLQAALAVVLGGCVSEASQTKSQPQTVELQSQSTVGPGAAQPTAGATPPVLIPPPTGVVNDFAHILDQATFDRITRMDEEVRSKSPGEIAIVTLRDIGAHTPVEVAAQIGNEWKVGKISKSGDPAGNPSVVILLVPRETSSDDRGHCFIATNPAAGHFIADSTAGDICREATPAFQQRDYATGLELVTLRTAQRFANEFKFSLGVGNNSEKRSP